MRFVFTMNMASSRGDKSIHQVIAEHPSKGARDLWNAMNSMKFLLVDLLYRRQTPNGDVWETQGEQVLNVALIGKVSPWVDRDPQQ